MIVWNDEFKRSHMRAWLDLLKDCVTFQPNADAFFLIEDDTIFCQGLREYLEQTLWLDDNNVALCSPYSIGPYRRENEPGWHIEKRSFYLVSSNAWVIPPYAARKILTDFAGKNIMKNNTDRQIGEWADACGYTTWFHTPSLGQHIGFCNSTIFNNTNSLGFAVDFVGEDKEPNPDEWIVKHESKTQ